MAKARTAVPSNVSSVHAVESAMSRSLARRGLKRLVDVVGAVVLIVFASPIMAIIALLLKVQSPGPVFFRQKRLGRDGIEFSILKFRSMYVDAEERLRADPSLYKLYVENDYKLPEGLDPRITPIGRILRRTSLDELPQLWNVLIGEMSLVGPRPIVPQELAEYGDRASLFLSVKPGITGYWQVCGRSDVRYPERCDLELYYVHNQSLRLDLMILLRTVTAVLSRRGAH